MLNSVGFANFIVSVVLDPYGNVLFVNILLVVLSRSLVKEQIEIQLVLRCSLYRPSYRAEREGLPLSFKFHMLRF